MSTIQLNSLTRVACVAALASGMLLHPTIAHAQKPVPAGAKTYVLPATPKTVAWGHYDARTPPVLRIRSGDTVIFHTVLTNSPDRAARRTTAARAAAEGGTAPDPERLAR